MENARKVADEIQRLLPEMHSGSLQFWGIWFGRPMENDHIIKSVGAVGDCLWLEFDCAERLQVWHPRSWIVAAREFSIFNASRVRWEWHHYDRTATPGNLMFYDFNFNGGDILFSSNFPVQFSQKPNPHAAAVILH